MKMTRTLAALILFVISATLGQLWSILAMSFSAKGPKPFQWQLEFFNLNPQEILIWIAYGLPILVTAFIAVIIKSKRPFADSLPLSFVLSFVIGLMFAPMISALAHIVFFGDYGAELIVASYAARADNIAYFVTCALAAFAGVNLARFFTSTPTANIVVVERKQATLQEQATELLPEAEAQ